MALLIWFTMGLALWHFTVFLPDRFVGGIIGALMSSITGSMVIGAIFQAIEGRSLEDKDLTTVLVAIPGSFIGLLIAYRLGLRASER